MRLKLDQDVLGWSLVMERITGVHVKDCFKDEEQLYVIVSPGELGKAIGKNGLTIKKVQEELNKKVKVIEFNDHIAAFVKNLIYPLQAEEIREEEENILIKDRNRKTRSALIGRDGKNLLFINRAVKRFFPNKEVRVQDLFSQNVYK